MRRKEKEITCTNELEEILNLGIVCRLGLSRDNIPYIVPMCFGYSDGCLYFHSSNEGLKLDYIGSNSFACFEVETGVHIIPAEKASKWDIGYRSVIGHGNIEKVSGRDDKLRAINILMEHYSGTEDWFIPENMIERVLILKLKITEMTGKRS